MLRTATTCATSLRLTGCRPKPLLASRASTIPMSENTCNLRLALVDRTLSSEAVGTVGARDPLHRIRMSETPAASADFSLRILWSSARWIEDTKGRAALARGRGARGGPPGRLRWLDASGCLTQQVETILTRSARELAGDEETFKSVFAYRFKESYGAFRYMVWAVSQQRMNEAAAKMGKVFTNVGRFEVLSRSRTRSRFATVATRPESRLALPLAPGCLDASAPRSGGMPPAQLTEHACIANGDEYCEYHLRWFDRSPRAAHRHRCSRWARAAAFLPRRCCQQPRRRDVFRSLVPLIGYVLELRRTGAIQPRVRAGSERGACATSARPRRRRAPRSSRSISASASGSASWSSRSPSARRPSSRSSRASTVCSSRASRPSAASRTTCGIPLFVVRGNTQFLRERFKTGEEGEALRDMEIAAVQIETMLSKLMEVATARHRLRQARAEARRRRAARGDVPPASQGARSRPRHQGQRLLHARGARRDHHRPARLRSRRRQPPHECRKVHRPRQHPARDQRNTRRRADDLVAGRRLDAAGGFLTLKLSDTGHGIAARRRSSASSGRGPPTSRSAPTATASACRASCGCSRRSAADST